MINISKKLLLNPTQIRISGVKCNFKNITKVVNIFNYKWIVMTIDSLMRDSSLLSLINDQGLKYTLKQRSDNYLEVSVIVPYSILGDILKRAISEDPENIFIVNFLNPTNGYIYLQHTFEELVVTGVANVFISISLDENAILILSNKYLVQPRELYRKIKTLRLG